jgi:hypothetical protein
MNSHYFNGMKPQIWTLKCPYLMRAEEATLAWVQEMPMGYRNCSQDL